MLQLLFCISTDTEESDLLSLWQTWWFISFVTLPCVLGDSGRKTENPRVSGLEGLWGSGFLGTLCPRERCSVALMPLSLGAAAGPGDPSRGRHWWMQFAKTAAARNGLTRGFQKDTGGRKTKPKQEKQTNKLKKTPKQNHASIFPSLLAILHISLWWGKLSLWGWRGDEPRKHACSVVLEEALQPLGQGARSTGGTAEDWRRVSQG